MLITSEFLRVVLTLYMLLLVLRWFGPWIMFDFEKARLRWATRLTDPLIAKIRQVLPPMGPVDFGPLAAIVAVWIIRDLSVGILRGGI